MGSCGRSRYSRNCVKTDSVCLGWVGSVAFGARVFQDFGWQLETVEGERNRKIPNSLRCLGKKRKENLALGVVSQINTHGESANTVTSLETEPRRSAAYLV